MSINLTKMTSSTALSKLCQANLGILSQKLGLLDVMAVKHGSTKAKELFQTPCSLVKASVGQHFRHSLDHMELAVKIAERPNDPTGRADLHYDVRERGCPSEHDMDAATERIFNLINMLEIVSLVQQTAPDDEINAEAGGGVQQFPVQAHFMLSGNSDTEFALSSSIGRELGFAAHHAIHHLAMVRIIATQTVGLTEDELPDGFGRAPSTQVFDNGQASTDEDSSSAATPSVHITEHKQS